MKTGKIVAIILAMLLTVALTACGGESTSAPADSAAAQQEQPAAAEEASLPEDADAPEADDGYGQQSGEEAVEQESSAQTEAAATKTMAYFMEYVSGGAYTMEIKTELDGISSVSLSVYDNGNVYTESEVDGMKSIVILKDGDQYILDPASKTCIKMSADIADIQEIFAEESANYETAVSTGEMEVNGGSYDYEEFSVEGSAVKYCFDGDELKYMVMEEGGEEYTVEILRMEKGADSSLFEIPADYTIMEM